jgi:uncharacterized protein (TIGR03083 family)
VDPHLDYLAHLAEESARFGDAIREVAPGTPVPTCPDWTADDLLWHLGWVQSWWGTIVHDNITGPEARKRLPERPPDWAGLQQFYERASRELPPILAAATPDTPAWTWSADHTVGFIRRKQAHEALIHRVDAEIVAGRRTPMDPVLSADGVDEALRIMYGGLPEWGSFTPTPGRTLRIHATDTGDTWLVELGRFTGTDPGATSYDEPDIHTNADDPGGPTTAVISASAADLDCWLWHRPAAGLIERSGDPGAISHFESAIAPGID